MVLAASIVGSGELIATTTLGAQVGFAALWIILVSCAIKPVVQGELGRYTIATGHTGLEGFNRVPGPRLGRELAGVGLGDHGAADDAAGRRDVRRRGAGAATCSCRRSRSTCGWPSAWRSPSRSCVGGGYKRIEKLALVKVGLLFTADRLRRGRAAAAGPAPSPRPISPRGLSFQLPAAGLATAIAVFGITGVGATELVQYPYWCVEKGYARYVGPRDGTPAWVARARGWLRVMHLDILCSLVIYTLATVAFYLLGAGILNRSGLVPAQRDMIQVLSRLYTQTLGDWALWLFYAGAVITLYGTIFASTAAHSRLFADAVRVGGGYARDDAARGGAGATCSCSCCR